MEALDGEGEELGHVGLVGGSGKREHGGSVHVGVGAGEFRRVAVARVEEVHGQRDLQGEGESGEEEEGCGF